MYEIIKNVINSKDYELSEMLYKINKMYIESAITEPEKTELDNLAREKANTDSSIDILNKLKEIDVIMQDLARRITELENPEVPTEPTEEYPEYVAGKWYYNGDSCSENGKNYTCVAPEGQVCVWSPSEYPAYWKEVEETKEVTEPSTEENVESEG